MLFVYRSMQKLTQLERLDLGSNEFTEVVSICHLDLKLSHLLDGDLISPSLFLPFSLFLYFNMEGWFFREATLHFQAAECCPSCEFYCPLCHLTSPLLISTAWGAGSAGWNQRAVDGWEQTHLFTWGIDHSLVCTHFPLELSTKVFSQQANLHKHTFFTFVFTLLSLLSEFIQ